MYKKHVINALLTTLLLAAICSTIYLYIELKEARELASSSQAVSAEEVAKITTEISKFMRLPDNEQPTVLTVNNVDQLKKQQQFFEHAKDGDKVLIYQQNRRAILYRPTDKKVIEVTPIAFNDQQNTQTSQQTQIGQEEVNPPQPQVAGAASNNQQNQERLQITVLNGTQDPQTTASAVSKIRASNGNININEAGNTSTQRNETIIILKESASRQERALAQDLVETLGGSIQTSVENEPGVQQSSTNIVVIVGQQ